MGREVLLDSEEMRPARKSVAREFVDRIPLALKACFLAELSLSQGALALNQIHSLLLPVAVHEPFVESNVSRESEFGDAFARLAPLIPQLYNIIEAVRAAMPHLYEGASANGVEWDDLRQEVYAEI